MWGGYLDFFILILVTGDYQIMVVEIKWLFFTFHFSPMNRVPRPKRLCQLQMLPSSTTIKLKEGLVIFQTTYRQMCLEILAHPLVCTGNKVSVSHSLRGSKMFRHLSLRENQNYRSCFCLWTASSVRQPVCFQQLSTVILPPSSTTDIQQWRCEPTETSACPHKASTHQTLSFFHLSYV